jgi:sec-independent protein translocase protein TatA
VAITCQGDSNVPIGPWELALLLVILLLIVGPGKLPSVGSAIGNGIRGVRRAATSAEDPARGEAATEASAAVSRSGETDLNRP